MTWTRDHPVILLVALIALGLLLAAVQPRFAQTHLGRWLADHEPGPFMVYFLLVAIAILIAIFLAEMEAAR